MSSGPDIYRWMHEHQIAEEDLLRFADDLLAIFMKMRRAIHSRYKLDESKYGRAFWTSLAVVLMPEKIAPEDWIQAQFDLTNQTHPQPSDMKGPYAAQLFEKWFDKRENPGEVQTMLELQAENLLQLRTSYPELGLAELLGHHTTNFSPLFCWCCSKMEREDELAKTFEMNAVRMLRLPGYRAVYSKAFKEVIKSDV